MIYLIIITLTCFILYFRAISYGYIIDDLNTANISKDKKPKNIFQSIYWNMLKRSPIYTNSKLVHLGTLITHALVSCLVYLAFGSNEVSFIAAMLFAVNPVNEQCSLWVSGVPYAKSTLLILLGIWLKPIFPLAYGASLLFSINTMLSPLLFLVENPYWYMVFILVGVANYLWGFHRQVLNRADMSTSKMREIRGKKIIVVIKTLGYYVVECLFPFKVGMFHDYLYNFGIDDKGDQGGYKIDKFFVIGIAFLSFFLTSLIVNYSPMTYGLYWFLLFFGIYSNFISINHPITGRYIYLANIGLMYALANLLASCIYCNYIALGLFVFYATKTYFYMPAYKNNLEFMKKNMEDFPKNLINYNQYAIELANYGRVGSAVDVWQEAWKIDNGDFRVNFNLANMLLSVGHKELAIKYALLAEENIHKTSERDKQNWLNAINNIKMGCTTTGVQPPIVAEG